MSLGPEVLPAPWAGRTRSAVTGPPPTPVSPWPCLQTDATVDRVFLPGATESLPDLGRQRTSGGDFRLWELPAPVVERDGGLVREGLTVTLRRQRGPSTTQRIELCGFPRLPRGATADGNEGAAPADEGLPWTSSAEQVESLIDTHVEAIGELANCRPPADALSWRQARGRRALRSVTDAVETWRAAGRGDVPRYALIVKLARELGALLPDVCKRPRVVLARDRQLRPVHRIEQIDGACLRWLARQPGWTVMEKAGPRQQVMSVVRQERADTLENRVVRDLLRRCERAGELYLRQHRRFASHARVELVRGFTYLVRRLQRETPVGSVSPLVGMPSPNYVLLHDARYRPLWDAYLRLVRHQSLLDSAWRWQRRVWAETLQLAVLAAMGELSTSPFAYRSELAVSPEHSSGRFLDPTSAVSPLSTRGGSVVDVLLGPAQAAKHPSPAARACADLSPDLVLVPHRRQGASAPVCLWATLLPCETLPELPADARGVVVSPGLPVVSIAARPRPARGVSWIELPLPVQANLSTLADALCVLVGSAR